MTDTLNDDVEVAITIGVARPAIASPLVFRWMDENGVKHEHYGTLCDGVCVPADAFLRALRSGTMEVLIQSSRDAALSLSHRIVE